MSIKEYSAELRALFTSILDVETGDGACALSLLDALEASIEEESTLSFIDTNDVEDGTNLVKDEVMLMSQVAEIIDTLIETLAVMNSRIDNLENNDKDN